MGVSRRSNASECKKRRWRLRTELSPGVEGVNGRSTTFSDGSPSSPLLLLSLLMTRTGSRGPIDLLFALLLLTPDPLLRSASVGGGLALIAGPPFANPPSTLALKIDGLLATKLLNASSSSIATPLSCRFSSDWWTASARIGLAGVAKGLLGGILVLGRAAPRVSVS